MRRKVAKALAAQVAFSSTPVGRNTAAFELEVLECAKFLSLPIKQKETLPPEISCGTSHFVLPLYWRARVLELKALLPEVRVPKTSRPAG